MKKQKWSDRREGGNLGFVYRISYFVFRQELVSWLARQVSCLVKEDLDFLSPLPSKGEGLPCVVEEITAQGKGKGES